jgi:hypothetical protein
VSARVSAAQEWYPALLQQRTDTSHADNESLLGEAGEGPQPLTGGP